MAGGGRRRVLVVEDDATLREVVAAALAGEGYAVRVAADAAAGLAVLRRWRPGLVVLDARMPGTGAEVAARVFRAGQAALPGAADVPVLLVSATWADRVLEELARELGASAWLAKPFGLDVFLATVDRLARG